MPFELTIKAGEAFGSGSHASTALMLGWIAEAMPQAEIGDRILDFGCGSGVLSIAMAKTGKGTIVACDRQEASINQCRENARQNGVISRITAFRAARPQDRRIVEAGPYRFIFSNILADILWPMLGGFHALLVPGGELFVSGLLRWQAPSFEQAAEAAGFTVTGRNSEGEWISLRLLRPAGRRAHVAESSPQIDVAGEQGQQRCDP